jgi:hypothetical protein
MNDAPVPLLAYILVGITSAVLAVVTAMDKTPEVTNAPATNVQTGGSETTTKQKTKAKTRKNKH